MDVEGKLTDTTVLVVDDVAASRYAMGTVLRRAGHHVVPVATGGEALVELDARLRRGVLPDVALVDGTYMVLGAVDPNGKPLPPRKGLLTSVLIKDHGTWQVAASRSMIPIPLPWRPQK